MSSNVCKICGAKFDSERGLHLHISRTHKVPQAEYYHKFYPRHNLLTGKLIPFKDKKDYFSKDFSNRSQLIEWCETKKSSDVAPYIKKLLSQRIKDKSLKYAPNHLEIELHKLPPIDTYKKIFGGYGQVCGEINVEPLFPKGIKKDFINKQLNVDELLIFIDTREQKPLYFKNSEKLKLDFGDYTASGDFYSKTYIDRKSEGDFKTTLSKFNLERFRSELQRARDFDSYLYIVVESSIDKIKVNNNFCPHKSNLNYIFHNMRVLQHEFRDNCQFLFSGSRRKSEELIPKLLIYGNKLWNVDVQYYIDKYGINC